MAKYLKSITCNDVLADVINGIGIIKLNRPNKLNALSLSMIEYITSKLKEFEKDRFVNIVYISGEGDKGFCSGGDINDLIFKSFYHCQSHYLKLYQINYEISQFKKPYVALIDGITMGAGVGLSIHGKYRISTNRTTFAMPETLIGMIPDVGASFFLPRMPHNLGFYLGLTGQRIKGLDVFHAKISTQHLDHDKLPHFEKDLFTKSVCNDSQFENVCDKYANQINPMYNEGLFSNNGMPHSPHSKLAFIKEAFNPIHFFNRDHSVAFEKFRAHLTRIYQQYDTKISDPLLGHAGRQLLLTQDSSVLPPMKMGEDQLKTVSPTSLKVTFKLLYDSWLHRWDLKTCLTHEYRLSVRLLARHDCQDGVKSLINRTMCPNWKPARLEDVPDKAVCDLFKPFTPNENIGELFDNYNPS